MTKIIFSTDKSEPKANSRSLYAKIYKKYNFKNIFESYLAWGPNRLELHCHVIKPNTTLIVDSMYYTEIDGLILKEPQKAPHDHLELLCSVFKLTIKS